MRALLFALGVASSTAAPAAWACCQEMRLPSEPLRAADDIVWLDVIQAQPSMEALLFDVRSGSAVEVPSVQRTFFVGRGGNNNLFDEGGIIAFAGLDPVESLTPGVEYEVRFYFESLDQLRELELSDDDLRNSGDFLFSFVPAAAATPRVPGPPVVELLDVFSGESENEEGCGGGPFYMGAKFSVRSDDAVMTLALLDSPILNVALPTTFDNLSFNGFFLNRVVTFDNGCGVPWLVEAQLGANTAFRFAGVNRAGVIGPWSEPVVVTIDPVDINELRPVVPEEEDDDDKKKEGCAQTPGGLLLLLLPLLRRRRLGPPCPPIGRNGGPASASPVA